MPSIALRYPDQWCAIHAVTDDPSEWEATGVKWLWVRKSIHGWLSRNAVRHSFWQDEDFNLNISILDSKMATLFKLTWGCV